MLVVLYCTVVFIARRLVIYVIIIYRIHVPGGSCLHFPWSYMFTTANLLSHNRCYEPAPRIPLAEWGTHPASHRIPPFSGNLCPPEDFWKKIGDLARYTYFYRLISWRRVTVTHKYWLVHKLNLKRLYFLRKSSPARSLPEIAFFTYWSYFLQVCK